MRMSDAPSLFVQYQDALGICVQGHGEEKEAYQPQDQPNYAHVGGSYDASTAHAPDVATGQFFPQPTPIWHSVTATLSLGEVGYPIRPRAWLPAWRDREPVSEPLECIFARIWLD